MPLQFLAAVFRSLFSWIAVVCPLSCGLTIARCVSCGAHAPHVLFCAAIYCHISFSCGNGCPYPFDEVFCNQRILCLDLKWLPHVCNAAGLDCRIRFTCGQYLSQVNLMRCSTIALLILCGTPSRTTRYPKQGECTAGVARGPAVRFPLLFGIAKDGFAMKKSRPGGRLSRKRRDGVAVMSR